MAVSYEGFYGGGGSAFDPSYGNLTGYNLNASMLGFPGSPQSANQVQDTVNAIKHGTKAFEVTMLNPETAETIPTQHFEEIRALMRLTGVKPSVHAPVIDAVGWAEQGWGKEEMRSANERRMFNAIEKAQVLDPSGNLPIVFHATNGTPGVTYRPGDKSKGEEDRVLESGTMVNMKTGQMQPAKREYKWRSSSFVEGRKDYGKPKLFSVETSMDAANRGDWENKLTEVSQMNKHAEEIIGAAPLNLDTYNNAVQVGGDFYEAKVEDGRIVPDKDKKLPGLKSTGQQESLINMKKAELFLSNAELSFEGAFDNAYEYGSEKQRGELKELIEEYNKKSASIPENMVWASHRKRELLDEAIQGLRRVTEERALVEDGKVVRDEKGRPVRDKDYGLPKIWKLSEELALEEASKTFGNLAVQSFDKFGEKAPVLAVENVYPTQALASADSLKKLVEASREKLVDHLVKEKGMGKKKAKKLAEDKIGVTWDVGHLNMVKAKGFTDEEVLRQTKLLTEDKSMVKHVHLTDNFGYADTHLVPGMGNVPTKEILEQLEKTGRFDEMRKIVEAGGVVQHFKKLPHGMALAAMGSPIYGMTSAGAWNQAVEMQGAYFGGYGNLNPQTHHSYFGAGFTTMPVELGGAMPGGGSRFGGTPMA